ncbi:hypothetical protein VNO77_25941 [Canavalia gladiata]|uniref:Uncharacterized protein n=1 Tax=Canavalia gladiata TaxID=3824 RepID=A0AAN9KRG5_CANGL
MQHIHEETKDEDKALITSLAISKGDVRSHDRTSNFISYISVLGQSKLSYGDGERKVDITQSIPGEGENLACCTEFAIGDFWEVYNDSINEVETDDAQDGNFLNSNVYVDLKMVPTLDAGTSARGLLIDIDNNNDSATIYADDGIIICQPHAIEHESILLRTKRMGCERIDASNDYGTLCDAKILEKKPVFGISAWIPCCLAYGKFSYSSRRKLCSGL